MLNNIATRFDATRFNHVTLSRVVLIILYNRASLLVLYIETKRFITYILTIIV